MPGPVRRTVNVACDWVRVALVMPTIPTASTKRPTMMTGHLRSITRSDPRTSMAVVPPLTAVSGFTVAERFPALRHTDGATPITGDDRPEALLRDRSWTGWGLPAIGGRLDQYQRPGRRRGLWP